MEMNGLDSFFIGNDDLRATEKTFLQSCNEFIEKHLSDPTFGAIRLAEMMDLSQSQLTRKMNKTLGTTPGRYILQIRLSWAKHLLLTTDEPIKRTAFTCGFSSYPAFWQAFEKRFGQSPGAYSQANTKKAPLQRINWKFPPENVVRAELTELIDQDPWFYNFLKFTISQVEVQNLTIDKLSKEFCCSPSGLTRRVKMRVGSTPMSFINQIRILRAIDFIEERRHSSIQVAYRLGYSDQSHFCRSFKTEVGMSISEFKKKNPAFLRFNEIKSIIDQFAGR